MKAFIKTSYDQEHLERKYLILYGEHTQGCLWLALIHSYPSERVSVFPYGASHLSWEPHTMASDEVLAVAEILDNGCPSTDENRIHLFNVIRDEFFREYTL